MFSVKLTVKSLIMIIACLHFPVALFKFQCLLLLSGFTALHNAVFKNNIQIVTYLVSLGADVNAQVSSLVIVIKECCLHSWIIFLTLSFDSLTSAIWAVQMVSCCLQREWHDIESFNLIIILGWYCPMQKKNIEHSRHCWGRTSLSWWSDSIIHLHAYLYYKAIFSLSLSNKKVLYFSYQSLTLTLFSGWEKWTVTIASCCWSTQFIHDQLLVAWVPG